ncbi:uncharacterized protein MONOS_1494 [Monocercomonoides exilis]|uniref:uncharacterized protein n=1 Tax=Monocercomonoides exilis TaxID=2049356 RepID=UPI00355A397B|nr:hypothetical protein MONOS_1494 [Monocercomonoides exilis]|eukprot:MONOS_1494.1-p1 / transcript=MONOS_1494.1 / gene=MONOS_1494 / organism=Monocercomonoides_exilis_PA203 / gene_product=unspecified product / transcript_product=unspecified product / location=Mono_scaffold00026:165944-166276(-) / protein_length=110 / sequence_SO=supercontig / SO=protein_coding / is_pseudo=false
MSSIHGGIGKEGKDRIVKDFREGKIKVLVATDLLSCSIDVQHASFVVNNDFVNEWFHINWRVEILGCYEGKSYVINMVTEADEKMMKETQEYDETKIEVLHAYIGELLLK